LWLLVSLLWLGLGVQWLALFVRVPWIFLWVSVRARRQRHGSLSAGGGARACVGLRPAPDSRDARIRFLRCRNQTFCFCFVVTGLSDRVQRPHHPRGCFLSRGGRRTVLRHARERRKEGRAGHH